MATTSASSGLNSIEPPPPGATPAETAEHYLAGFEGEFRRARRVVKKRASGVTVAISTLTGVLAILGSVAALLATDLWSAGIAILTTTISATVSVLLAWNDHFHHRELWVQRSAVLAEINGLRRQYTMRSKLPWYMRRPANMHAALALRDLDDILKRDLESWTQIKTNKPNL